MYRIFIFLIVLSIYSCVPHKKIVLLQKTTRVFKDTVDRVDLDYKLLPRDRVYIRVSSYNKNVTEFFNIQSGTTGQSMQSGSGMGLLNSYMIKESGYIELPLLDSLNVGGLTLQEMQKQVQDSIRMQVSDATVVVSFANFQVTVLGEVNSQGVVNSNMGRMTVFDAIATSGGVMDFADRKHVKIVRKQKDSTVIGTIDLTNREIFQSEFYYLHPNDMVYVDRLKSKTFLNNLGTIARVVGIFVGFALLERTLNIIK
jgi:polysaccharide biosynthesis/export protein